MHTCQTGLQHPLRPTHTHTRQCEATQFSLLTVFPDRPDVLSRWSVRLEADAASCPVLLSNGSMTQAGQLPGGRHFAVWEVRLL